MKLSRTAIGILITIVSAIAYGAYPPAARGVYLDGGNATLVMIVTTWFRALTLAGFCLLTQRKFFISSEDKKSALAGGFFQSISIVGIFTSLLFLPGPLTIAIVFTHTLMQLFFMAWRKEIRLNFPILASTIIALMGLTFVLDIWHAQEMKWIGVVLAFMSAMATASRMYVYGKQTQTKHAAIVGAEAFLVSAIFISFIALFNQPILPHSTSGYLWLAIASLSLALGTFAMFYGIAMIGPFSFSMFLKLEPIFTAIFSVLFIREILQWHQYAGVIAVVASLLAYQYFSTKIKSHA